ncbi:MAG: hypothetical protein ABI353_17850 [Isosphaeraceae bacterium]
MIEPTRIHWCLQDRLGRLWHDDGRGRAALELHVAEQDARATGAMPAVSRAAFPSVYPYGYPVPEREV